jgi:hypothetical protein
MGVILFEKIQRPVEFYLMTGRHTLFRPLVILTFIVFTAHSELPCVSRCLMLRLLARVLLLMRRRCRSAGFFQAGWQMTHFVSRRGSRSSVERRSSIPHEAKYPWRHFDVDSARTGSLMAYVVCVCRVQSQRFRHCRGSSSACGGSFRMRDFWHVPRANNLRYEFYAAVCAWSLSR